MDQCPAALQLERDGYSLVKHTAKFGTILQYRKKDEWRFVIPSMPKKILTRQESLSYIKDKWNFRRPSENEYWIKRILVPLLNM